MVYKSQTNLVTTPEIAALSSMTNECLEINVISRVVYANPYAIGKDQTVILKRGLLICFISHYN